MSVPTKTWQVGIIGLSSSGLFLVERIGLERTIQVCGGFDRSPDRLKLAPVQNFQSWNSIDAAIMASDVDALIFCDDYTQDQVAHALHQGKHVVLDAPWQLTPAELRQLDELADACQRTATVACYRRWSSTFLAALEAKRQIGTLNSVRFESFEQTISTDLTSRGVLREFGYDHLDQLWQLVDSTPVHVIARQEFDPESKIDHSLTTTIEFASGCAAQIEIQTRSRLSFRTGWMLEGSKSSFRSNRRYSTATDGEIIDEPTPTPLVTGSPFIESLIATWQGKSAILPRLNETAHVVDLMQKIQQSASSWS